ncbi:DUF2783 domain-containing protein [Zobellella maritima]|uniref:DUF2783 domain-containing protein n=1 Tax=Zobellella maritima TaxID=2059725 RepID=UPI000E3044F5|nr:DUF2783 domain-containing protein [Zobellella maritima]
MSDLKQTLNCQDPDHIYTRLIDLHRVDDVERSLRINARLILLLANHIGDTRVLEQAFDIADAMERQGEQVNA